jgi:hypothetical protein
MKEDENPWHVYCRHLEGLASMGDAAVKVRRSWSPLVEWVWEIWKDYESRRKEYESRNQ